MNNAIGIDVSTWQDNSQTPQRIDWTKPKLYDVKFVINRAVFGTLTDEDFYYNFAEQKRLGYIRSAYGFLDYRTTAPTIADQARAFVNVLKSDHGDMPLVFVDFEQANSNWPTLPSRGVCLSMLQTYMGIVEDGLGIQCGLYTSPKHIKYNLSLFSGDTCLIPVPDWLKDKNLWVAAWPSVPAGEDTEDYIERTGWQPNLYGQWDYWTFWQYGTPAEGLGMGMESKEIDKNYFMGTEQELKEFCNLDDDGDPIKMWENNVMIASFDKASTYNSPTNVDFVALKAAGFDAVMLRAGTSDDRLNYDDPSADYVPDTRFPSFFNAATAAGLRVLIDYDFNAMLDSTRGYDGFWTLRHINNLLSGGFKPAAGGALILNCERNTWYESIAFKTCTSNMYGQDLRSVFDAIWTQFRLVPGARTGTWFLNKKDEGGVVISSQLPWLDKGEANVPMFLVRLKKPIGTFFTGNVHDLVADVPDPTTTYITVDGKPVKEQSLYLYFGNQTKWKGWEVAWVKNNAVKDAQGNLAVFRAIIWDGDKKAFDTYFNFPAVNPDPDPDPDPDPEPNPELEARVKELEDDMALLKSSLKPFVES